MMIVFLCYPTILIAFILINKKECMLFYHTASKLFLYLPLALSSGQ